MTPSGGQHRGHRGTRSRTQADDDLGPQGVVLIRELERIRGAFDRQLEGGPNAPRMDVRRARAANSNEPVVARKPGGRTGVVGRTIRGLLQLPRSDDGDRQSPPSHPARSPESGPRSEPAGTVRSQHRRNSARTVADSPSNILELPIDGMARRPRPPQRAPDDQAQSREASKSDAGSTLLHLLGRVYRALVGRTHQGDLAEGEDAELARTLRRGFEAELRTGLRVLVLGLGVTGAWAALVPLSAAVTVAGSLVVESNVKKVQHPNGGVIAQILVHDGMRVHEGDLLARLDEVQVRANLQVVASQLDETQVRIARLMAERDGADELRMPPDLTERSGDANLDQLIRSETQLFKARTSARQSQKELLRGHIVQLGDEITGLEAQIKSKASQLDLIAGELQGVQSLYDKQLVPLTRLTALQREAANLEGSRGQLVSAIAETRSKTTEAELQVVRIDEDLRTEVGKDLRESEDKQAELRQRKVAAQDQLDRIEIRAPTSGLVHQLSVHTIGGVISPGEVMMEIVPDSDELQVEARLRPTDIDQVRMGQNAGVRFPAFNQRTTPQLSGVVSYVSADISHDPKSENDAGHYTVRVTLPADEVRRLGSLQLVSGMPAEVFLKTGSRTMLSYLLKPLTDQLQRTFSER